MHPLTRDLALTTLFIPALWGSAYFWGKNHADSTSSQYIGAAMLTFFSTAFFIFFNILTMLTLGGSVFVSANGGDVKGHTTILRALLVFVILLAIILAVTGFLFGSGESNNDTTMRDGAEIGSFAVAVITLVALGFVWLPILTFKLKGA